MTVLITGGAGFIGLNVAERLLERGDDVVLFGPEPPPVAALAMLQKNTGQLLFIKGDVSEAGELDGALSQHGIDRIVHCAAITADLEREKRAARDIITINLLGTIEVLEAALRHKIRRVVQLGTGSIFGAAGRATEVLDEQDSAVLPETLYGISKFAAERTGLRYRHTRGVNLTVVRLGMVFGRWEYNTGVRDTLSLALQLLRVAEGGGSAVVHAHAADDWVYSVDVARGLVAVLDMPESPEPVYHLSAGMRWSVPEWCRHLHETFPDFQYRMTEDLGMCTVGRNKAVLRSPMSIVRICRDTDYKPAFLLEQAFTDFLAWNANARACGWV